ncbi:STAS domain-containing protein [Paenibacillus sp. GCM10023252]|uniref:STAS domain-containing protein n=1 Tax=Paenibacillus sp. GCM10023252 TaxID=3252649 RepID=UPI00360A2C00
MQEHLIQFDEMVCDSVQHITASGKLTYNNYEEAKMKLAALNKTSKGCIMDIRKLTLIDSTGFGVLIYYKNKIASSACPMVIILDDSIIRELFYIAKLDLVFTLCGSLEEARKIMEACSKGGAD